MTKYELSVINVEDQVIPEINQTFIKSVEPDAEDEARAEGGSTAWARGPLLALMALKNDVAERRGDKDPDGKRLP